MKLKAYFVSAVLACSVIATTPLEVYAIDSSTYRGALQNVMKFTLPDGEKIVCHLPVDEFRGEFTINDVDGDGQDDLILWSHTGANADFFLAAYSYQEGSGSWTQLFRQHYGGQGGFGYTFYDNGYVICDFQFGFDKSTNVCRYNSVARALKEVDISVDEAIENASASEWKAVNQENINAIPGSGGQNTNSGKNIETTAVEGMIFPDSASRIIPESEYKALSFDQLRLAVNEIYARHGYTFKDSYLASYFSKYSWYQPTGKDANAAIESMNEYERTNVDEMGGYLNKLKGN